MWLTVLLLFLSVILFLFYNYRKRCVKAVDLPGPSPHWLMGNLASIKSETNPLVLQLRKWTKEFGRLYVYYEGSMPVVVVSDPDLMQEVFVKQFSSFHGRKRFPFQPNPDKAKRASMFVAEGERWKRLRTVVNPAFTELKMRAMYPLVKKNIDALIANLDKEIAKGPVVETYDFYKRMALDVIAECAFGVGLNCQQNPQHEVFVNLKNFFDVQLIKRTWLLTCAQSMPELRPLFRLVMKFVSTTMQKRNFLTERMKEVIEERRAPEARRVDILQLLLDAENPDVARSKTTRKALSTEEVQEQALLFLFAGYETSSTALGYLTHLLATHPDVHDRLQSEVDDVYKDLGEERAESEYEHLSELPYMDKVINESLRLYPIGNSVVNRRCAKTVSLGGHVIPEGATIAADVYTLHFDPDLWGPTDPKVFDPDRFDTKRHPMAWIPFGAGPRFCVGQRFALMEIRATLLRLLHRFNIRACPETQDPLQLKFGPTTTPKSDVTVRLERRKRK